MYNAPTSIGREDYIACRYLLIENIGFFLGITIDTENTYSFEYFDEILFDLLDSYSYRINLRAMTFWTYDGEWCNLVAMMADEALMWSGMIGECNITMWTLLIVTTVCTDPGPCIASTRIEYERFLS